MKSTVSLRARPCHPSHSSCVLMSFSCLTSPVGCQPHPKFIGLRENTSPVVSFQYWVWGHLRQSARAHANIEWKQNEILWENLCQMWFKVISHMSFDIIWLMKQVQDKDPAVQNVDKFSAPHVSRVNIDIDEQTSTLHKCVGKLRH